MDKAAKQEYELRQAQIELEERRRQEQELARELAEREEATMMVEEQFASLSEEVDVKTKKLKKVWQKYQQTPYFGISLIVYSSTFLSICMIDSDNF